jgi:hypothetical protein
MSLSNWTSAQQRVYALHESLATGSFVTTEEVLSTIDNFADNLQTNCEAATQGLFAAVAPICLARPELQAPLLRRALKPLVYLGVEHPSQAVEFLTQLARASETYLPLTPASRDWLAASSERAELIGTILLELVSESTDEG